MTRIVEDVDQRLIKDRDIGARISATLGVTSKDNESKIRSIFPEIHDNNSLNITNLPRGIHLRQYILYGQRVIFDIEPYNSDIFEQKHLMRIGFVKELVQEKLIFPNLYVRDASKWGQAADMAPLVKLSVAAGERVDQFMATLGNYSNFVENHTRSLNNSIQSLSTTQYSSLLRTERTGSLEDFAFRHARRWAYLDILDPVIAKDAADLLQSGRLKSHLQFVSLAKPYVASSMTAALGGTYVFGPNEQRVAPRPAPKHLWGLEHPEAIEYLLMELSGIPPFRLLEGATQEKKLLDFLTNPANIRLRNELPQRLDDLWNAARSGSVFEPTVRDYRYW